MNYNATVAMIEPHTQVSDTDPLQREHPELQWDPIRCHAEQASATRTLAVIGQVGVEVWDLRLQLPRDKRKRPPRIGWRCKLNIPGEHGERELVVVSVTSKQHLHLICQGVG